MLACGAVEETPSIFYRSLVDSQPEPAAPTEAELLVSHGMVIGGGIWVHYLPDAVGNGSPGLGRMKLVLAAP